MDAALYYCVKLCRFPEPYLNFRLTACTTSRYFQYFPPDCVFSGLRLMFSLWISLYPLNMTWFLNSSLWHSYIKTVFRSKLDVQKSSAISSINIFNPARKCTSHTLDASGRSIELSHSCVSERIWKLSLLNIRNWEMCTSAPTKRLVHINGGWFLATCGFLGVMCAQFCLSHAWRGQQSYASDRWWQTLPVARLW